MTTVFVYQYPHALFSKLVQARFSETLSDFTNQHIQFYDCIELDVKGSGVDAAEEVFDLSNNPMRVDEMFPKSGLSRPLNVGDVVDVERAGIIQRFLCMDVGWKELNVN